MNHFLGREQTLDSLKQLSKKKTASLAVLKGRRRIGKSRLAEEFARSFPMHYIFTGLAPNKSTTAHMQREDFAAQLTRLLTIRGIKADDWGDLFWHLAQATGKGQVLIVLDEINWMGSKDPTFLAKLKSAWDLYFKKNARLILMLSGSMSAWIERNILSSTGFMGRISWEMTLDELPLPVCNQFWGKYAPQVSAYEKFKILSVTGGVPRYLEEIDPTRSAEDNIATLAFSTQGILFHEFERIFNDLFAKRSAIYQKIVEQLAYGSLEFNKICEALELQKSGAISQYLEELIETGYITRDYTWHLKTGKTSSLSRFRLSDNYLRFYLRYILPNKAKIEKGRVLTVPAWHSIMGLQFENLVIQNAKRLEVLLHINPESIVFDNPFYQRTTAEQKGCQIDYLIQTSFNTLYVFEIKFSKNKIGSDVIHAMQEKLLRLSAPKGYSIRPILIHVNGVTDAVLASDFFSNIIDFGQFLE